METQDILNPHPRKHIPFPGMPNQNATNNNINNNNNISQSSENEVKMGICFSDFDSQPSVSLIRRNTPQPGQFKLNLDEQSSSSNLLTNESESNNSSKPPNQMPKIPPVPLNKAKQPSTNPNQIPNIKMNIDFNKFDNTGSSIRLPTPRPGQTLGPGGIPDDEYCKLTNSYMSIENEEEESENYEDVRIDINQIPLDDENIQIDADNYNNNENFDQNTDVQLNIDYSQFDNQYHTNRFSTPRPDKVTNANETSIGEEEEEEAMEPNDMENVRIDVPQEFDDTQNSQNNADVSMNIDFSQFDGKTRAIRMPTPRPDIQDEGIELEEDEEEPKKSNLIPKPNANKRIPMLPKLPNTPGSLPSPKIPKKVLPKYNINNINNNSNNNTSDDVKVDIDFKQFDGCETAIRMPTPRPSESSLKAQSEALFGGEEEEEAFEDDENDMANVVIAIPLDPADDNNDIVDAPDDVTMNIDFSQFDGQTTSNHLATPRPDKTDATAINAEEEEEEAEIQENAPVRKFSFKSPLAPKRTCSTPQTSPSPSKTFKFSIPASSDADNDFNTDTLTDTDDFQFYVPNENNLSTPRPGHSCVVEASKDAIRAEDSDDEEENANDEPIVINTTLPLVPQDEDLVDSPKIQEESRPIRRSTPRPVHNRQHVFLENLQAEAENEPTSPSNARPKSTPPFKVKSAANYHLPLIPLNSLKRKNKDEAKPQTENVINGEDVVGCSSTPPNKNVVKSPPKSSKPSPNKIPLLNFGALNSPSNKKKDSE